MKTIKIPSGDDDKMYVCLWSSLPEKMRNISRANVVDLLHRILVVDLARDDTSLAWTTWELDAFGQIIATPKA